MSPIIDEVFDHGQPYRCPKCGNLMECSFHERDSTSDSMHCPVCHWWAHTAWDGEWYSADDTPLDDAT